MATQNSCGIGGWGGPLAGDPSNDSILTASFALGGIDISWGYPTTNPQAVAYTKLYRGLTTSFVNAVLRAEVGGSFFYDKLETNTRYYYWIQMVSVNGTLGAIIGPATAVAVPSIQKLIQDLTAQIDSGMLSISLRNKLDQISVLNTNLLNETFNRENGETTLAQALAGVSSAVAQGNTYLLNEIATRTTQNSALIEQINGVAASAGGNTAATIVTLTASVDALTNTTNAMYTAKVTVNGLVGGFGLANNGTTVDAGFDVDRFWIGRTSGDKRKPFIIDNGVVYIDEATIRKITATQIDSRGLSIKDAAGNVILAAGAALDFTSRFGGYTTGMPANNATVGATWGANIVSQPTTLGGINSTEGTKLGGIASGATANQSDLTTNNAIATKLAKSGADIITGPISLGAANAIQVGTINDGLYLGSTGLVGRRGGTTSFSIDAAGNATFAGSLEVGLVTALSESTSATYGVPLVGGDTTNANGVTGNLTFTKSNGDVLVTVQLEFQVFLQTVPAGQNGSIKTSVTLQARKDPSPYVFTTLSRHVSWGALTSGVNYQEYCLTMSAIMNRALFTSGSYYFIYFIDVKTYGSTGPYTLPLQIVNVTTKASAIETKV